MKYLNTKLYIWTLVLISITYYLLIFLYITDTSTNITITSYLKPIPIVVTLDTLTIYIFVKWLWKWNKLYPWLVPFPNLNGTWRGFLKSNWVCPETNKNPEKIPTILTINQSFTHVSCVMRTGEMCSESFSAEICIDPLSKKIDLVYSYKSTPNADIRHRSQLHFGTVKLDIVGENKKLVGEYWTSRETTGFIDLEFWKNKKFDKYPKELGAHPMSEI